MTLITYLAFGLVCAHADAMACFVSKRGYHVYGSLLCCLFWPLAAVLVIYTVARGKRDRR